MLLRNDTNTLKIFKCKGKISIIYSLIDEVIPFDSSSFFIPFYASLKMAF